MPFILQYVYYAFETGLIVLEIAFAQEAGEQKFQRKNIPWGGIFLALTWGAMHILLKGPQAGLGTMMNAFLYGIVFILLKKDVRVAYPLIFVAFAL